MLRAPEFFQTALARQNSKTSRPSLLRNFRLRVPVLLHHRLPEHLQPPREEKRKPSDKSLTTYETLRPTDRLWPYLGHGGAPHGIALKSYSQITAHTAKLRLPK